MKEYMLLPVEIKSIDDKDDNYIYVTGLASVYNNIDLGRDRVLPGAFTKSLIKRGDKRPALWQHNFNEPVGVKTYTDTASGLQFVAALPKSDKFVMERLVPQIEVGSIGGASIGYYTVKSEYNAKLDCRDLIELDLVESSFVTAPMNELAQINAISKSIASMPELKDLYPNLEIQHDTESKAVPPYQDFAMAPDDTKWQKTKSVNDLRANTDSKEKPSKEYRKGFMFYDSEDVDNFTAYKMPFVYFMDGEFKAVPKALSAIVGALAGARSGVDIPDADRKKIEAQINRYYEKMGRESPFQGDKTFIDGFDVRNMENRDCKKLFDNDIILTSSAKKYIVDTLANAEMQQSGQSKGQSKERSTLLKSILDDLEEINV